MNGSTHLAIGAAIGIGAILYYPFNLNHDTVYLSVAAFSALSADLDGASLLSSKLSKLSHWLRELVLWTGVLLVTGAGYFYFAQDLLYPAFSTIAVTLLLIGFATKDGIIRNTLVSLIGCGLLYAGWTSQQNWLMGLGLFVAVAPWLKHRGMTHTVWALLLWGAIGWGLENHLQIEGIMLVSIAGYASHLIADTITPHGVKWLFPLYNRSFKLPFFK